MRTANVIELTDEQRQQRQRWTRSTASVRLAGRARIILVATEGMDNHRIAAAVGVGRVQVGRWRKRFEKSGLTRIETDLPRSGRKPRINAAKVVRLTTPRRRHALEHARDGGKGRDQR